MGERSVLQSLNRVGSTRSAPSASSPAAQAAYAAGSPHLGRPRRSDPGGPRKSAAFTGRKSWARWPFTWGRRRSSISKFFEKMQKKRPKGRFFLVYLRKTFRRGRRIIPRTARGRKIPPSGRKDGRPHHLFFTKRDGAAWRYQRKIVGGQETHCPSRSIKSTPDTPTIAAFLRKCSAAPHRGPRAICQRGQCRARRRELQEWSDQSPSHWGPRRAQRGGEWNHVPP